MQCDFCPELGAFQFKIEHAEMGAHLTQTSAKEHVPVPGPWHSISPCTTLAREVHEAMAPAAVGGATAVYEGEGRSYAK